jgi:small subunit ribosomal protein S6
MNRMGHYLHLNLRAPSAAIDELERQERLSDDVIRYLTVRVDELEDGPSIIMQVRSSREERSRRPHEDGPRRFDGDRPRRDEGDRPRRDDGDRPRRDDGDRPRRDDGERPRRAAERTEDSDVAGDARSDAE